MISITKKIEFENYFKAENNQVLIVIFKLP